MKKVLILGGQGRLARALLATQPLGLNVCAVSRAALDITQSKDFEALIQTFEPHVVINAAAWTDVGGAQAHRDEVFRVNAVAPAKIASTLAQRNIPLVHYSTDYVFSGEGHTPWYEDSVTAPKVAGVYGLSKWEGEKAVRESGVRGVVIRAGWLHTGERDFVAAILMAALAKKPLKVTASQIGTPTQTESLARWTWQNLPLFEAQTSTLVIHYVESGGWVTRAEFADYLLQSAETSCARQGLEAMKEAFRDARLGLTITEEIDDIRPANCRLATRYLERFSGGPCWKKGVDKSVENVIKSKMCS